jgi:hypothetical protein
MHRSFRVTNSCIVLMIFALLGCEAVPSPIPLSTPFVVATPTDTPAPPTYAPATPTFTPSPNLSASPSPSPTATAVISPTVNTTPTRCGGFMWAYGTVSPEFVSQMQEAMQSAGVEGSVRAGTFGETDTCGMDYGAIEIDIGFTIQVGAADTPQDVASKVLKVQEIAMGFRKEASLSMGNFGVTFKSRDLQCIWRYEQNASEFFPVNNLDRLSCGQASRGQGQSLDGLLTALSTDLRCETFHMEAGMSSVRLECERSQGTGRYRVEVTFALGNETSANTCFHGWPALQKNPTGAQPVTPAAEDDSFREQSFGWTADGLTTIIAERIQGGEDIPFPSDTYEKVYVRAVNAGLMRGAGTSC